MAKIANYTVENEVGCGFIGGIFHRQCKWLRKSPVYSLPPNNPIIADKVIKAPSRTDSPKRRSSSSSAASVDRQTPKKHVLTTHTRTSRRPSDAARTSTSSSTGSTHIDKRQQRSEQSCAELSRVSTPSNAIVLANVGNLKQTSNGNKALANLRNGYGNIVRKSTDDQLRLFYGQKSKLEEPEVLKWKGNEAYKLGKYEVALGFYEKAIGLDSGNAVYYCNKGAALIRLDRVWEAVEVCKQAIRIQPNYHKAHNRLATLYLRLGQMEKAIYHLTQSGSHVELKEIEKAQALENCLSRCTEARKLQDWDTLLKETQFAIFSGSNAAHKVFALQAEALMRLRRYQEAYETYQKGRNLNIDFTKLLDLSDTSYIFMIEAQVYMTMGRFEDAVAAAQKAAQLDPSNKEVSTMAKRVRSVSSSRLTGNLLFKSSKFSQAFIAYSEGLELDPYNSVLLCNRAACRSKLSQFEKAVEDCTAALHVQPSYSKARLRRANCNSKLERWEASIQDYEVLIRETPGNEEVGRALFEAQLQLKRQRGEDIKDMKFGSNLVSISSNERFRHFVTSPGMSVVLFCKQKSHKQVLQVLEQVCKRYPSVNFLKVEIEDHPYLAKSEGVSSVPAFKIYKNGSRVKEIPGSSHQLLESSVKLYSS